MHHSSCLLRKTGVSSPDNYSIFKSNRSKKLAFLHLELRSGLNGYPTVNTDCVYHGRNTDIDRSILFLENLMPCEKARYHAVVNSNCFFYSGERENTEQL